jgi:ankyrin repeat protein
MWVAVDDYTDFAMSLPSIGIDLDLESKYSDTTLISAVLKRHTDLAKNLIENGADLNQKDNNGVTALMRVAQYGYDYQDDYVYFGYDNWEQDYNNMKDIARILIEKGADLNLKDNDGFNALMWAVQNDNYDIAKILIENGADLNLKDKGGLTAFMWAARLGDENIGKMLIEKGADLDL